MNWKSYILLSAGVFVSLTAAKSQWIQVGQDIDGEFLGNLSGYSVSLSSDGSIVAIGATRNYGNSFESGQVRVYEYVSGSWSQVGADIDGEGYGDHSGMSVSISADGSMVAIGAGDNDGNGQQAGHVGIFKNALGTWTQIGEDIDGEEEYNYCGKSVSLSADGLVVAIGAWGNSGNGWASGHVRIYKYSSGNWVQVGADIEGKGPDAYSGFAVSLSADGSVVATGASGGNGSVSIYENLSGNWNQTGEDILGDMYTRIGEVVSLSPNGRVVAIGSPRNEDNGWVSGLARIYDYTSGSWMQKGEDIKGEALDFLGNSLSLSSDGNVVAIGAPQLQHDNETWGGYVRIFEFISGSWIQTGDDINAEAIGDDFGRSVSLTPDGSTVAIGAPENDGNSYAGHVRIYHNGSQNIGTFEDYNLTIYPNPADGVLIIESKNNEIIKVILSDITGKIISNKVVKDHRYHLDISGFERGVYLIRIQTDKAIFSRKIMKK